MNFATNYDGSAGRFNYEGTTYSNYEPKYRGITKQKGAINKSIVEKLLNRRRNLGERV